jgi:hypothetical protein
MPKAIKGVASNRAPRGASLDRTSVLAGGLCCWLQVAVRGVESTHARGERVHRPNLLAPHRGSESARRGGC